MKAADQDLRKARHEKQFHQEIAIYPEPEKCLKIFKLLMLFIPSFDKY